MPTVCEKEYLVYPLYMSSPPQASGREDVYGGNIKTFVVCERDRRTTHAG